MPVQLMAGSFSLMSTKKVTELKTYSGSLTKSVVVSFQTL